MHQRNEAQVSHTSTLSHFLPRCQEDIKAQGYASESTSASLQLGATISRTLVRGGGDRVWKVWKGNAWKWPRSVVR